MRTLRVSAKSNSSSIADALTAEIKDNGVAEIQAVGAGALSKAIKAIAIARGCLKPIGMDLVCIPTYTDMEIDGEENTDVRLTVEPRK